MLNIRSGIVPAHLLGVGPPVDVPSAHSAVNMGVRRKKCRGGNVILNQRFSQRAFDFSGGGNCPPLPPLRSVNVH